VATTTLSRRASEFAGVAVFAASLIWLIALVTHEPSDHVWFITAGDAHPASNFIGPVGAFLSEVSLQVLGYTSYMVPMVLGVVGWNLFCCRPVDSEYTKATGAGLFFGCLSALFALVVGSADLNGRSFHAGGYIGEWLGGLCQAYLNRPGAIIVVLTLLALAVILSTQFSFGRTFRAMFETTTDVSGRGIAAFRGWREERRREAERREVIAKHTRKNGPAAGAEAATAVAAAKAARAKEKEKEKERLKERGKTREPIDDDDDLDDEPAAATPIRRASDTAPQVRERARVTTPVLPLGETDTTSRAPVERRMGGFTPPPLSLLDAPKAQRKLDER
jgi:S-DNA-T family DNA segregation ATPase FtsK/SpoIIIE